ncbi:MAG: trypsin-like peptidase domain-containing protein [Phycisphaerales bacterium]
MSKRTHVTTAVAIAVLGSLVLGGSAFARSPQAEAAVATRSEGQGARRKADDLSRAFRDAARTLAPSVVTINTKSTASRQASPNMRIPPSFPSPAPAPTPARGTGTGVVISRDGHIVTANHVVADATEIEIVFRDGRTATATVVGLDPGTDIAVLRTDASGLVPAAFGDSDELEAGEWVVALGAPFGLEQTLTAGIVSAKGRSDVGLATFESYIQTDAAINPGNSGGPLANLDGEIVGINSAISSRGGGNDGIGFAVPSSVVRRVVDSLIANGRVARGYLGVGVQQADGGMLAGLGTGVDAGVLVNRVERGSPADTAGLEPGDVITRVAGKPVRTPGELVAAIGGLEPGREIDLHAVRSGDARTLHATLAERHDAAGSEDTRRTPPRATPELERLGLALRAIDADDAASLGLTGTDRALVVESVEPSSPAHRAGLAAGDVVRRIVTRGVSTVADARAAIANFTADAAIPLLIEREGRARFVLVERGTASDTDR